MNDYCGLVVGHVSVVGRRLIVVGTAHGLVLVGRSCDLLMVLLWSV